MRIRMLPISFAFSRFPRLVHDLSLKLGKKVELKLSGEQTELDKTVMEKIGDPLVHLVRNALDHGIEVPDVRRSRGKPEVGQIHLDAYHQGGNIVIEVSDDGAGLNRERIAAKARERGLLPEDGEIDEARIIDLIFDPGFSTAETVSDVSGRGVGMDVVRRNIRDLGGNVEVDSQPGQGSRFTIRLPLTLAILDGQLVRIGDQVYVAPLISIVESLQVRAERVNAVAGRGEVYRLRDEYIPIMDLRRIFGGNTAISTLSGSLLVVVEGEGKKVGLVVDDLLGQQQVVIKSLETNYRPVAGISGATILGNGTVALILDACQLVNSACGIAAHEDRASGKLTAAA
jgi:two-component system chemotaxis sensor kinase CheA